MKQERGEWLLKMDIDKKLKFKIIIFALALVIIGIILLTIFLINPQYFDEIWYFPYIGIPLVSIGIIIIIAILLFSAPYYEDDPFNI